jgi:hypothetical protein
VGREDTAQALREERERLERLVAARRPDADLAGEAGEVAGSDQHQADSATVLEQREEDLGRIVGYERRIREIEEAERRLAAGLPPVAADPGPPFPRADAGDDDRTPLDEVGPPPEDLASIPMSRERADVVADPQEDDDLPDMDMPGALYPDEGAPPGVGEPEAGDATVRRMYRPE